MSGLLFLSLVSGSYIHAAPISVVPGQVLGENLVLCTPTEGVTEQGTITATGTAATWISIASPQSWSDGPDTVTNCDTIPYSITVPLSASGSYELVWTINTCTFVDVSGFSGTCGGLPETFVTLDFQVTSAISTPQFPSGGSILGVAGLLAVAIVGLSLIRRNGQRRPLVGDVSDGSAATTGTV
jgi:hypothetical protein